MKIYLIGESTATASFATPCYQKTIGNQNQWSQDVGPNEDQNIQFRNNKTLHCNFPQFLITDCFNVTIQLSRKTTTQ